MYIYIYIYICISFSQSLSLSLYMYIYIYILCIYVCVFLWMLRPAVRPLLPRSLPQLSASFGKRLHRKLLRAYVGSL